jgi:hypothetical protein
MTKVIAIIRKTFYDVGIKHKKSPDLAGHLAEREGFEPPEAFTSTVFKTAAFDRSAISPGAK